MPYGTPPPEPDLVAQRGTDQWRDAVHAKKQWIAQNLARGVPLEQLVEKYGEGGSSREGRLSHDYEYWDKAMRGEEMGAEGLPGELGEAQWDIGNFRRQASVGDWTEWPPGSGMYFNDPANDSSKREWRDQYGDPAAPPADGGPVINYEDVIRSGMTPQQWLSKEAEYKRGQATAKAYRPEFGTPPAQPGGGTGTKTAPASPMGQRPTQPLPTAPGPRPPTGGGPPAQPGSAGGVGAQSEGAWGVNRPVGGVSRGFGTRMQPSQPNAPMQGPSLQQPASGGFGSSVQKRRGNFGNPLSGNY